MRSQTCLAVQDYFQDLEEKANDAEAATNQSARVINDEEELRERDIYEPAEVEGKENHEAVYVRLFSNIAAWG